MKAVNYIFILLLCAALFAATGCNTSRTAKGAVIGGTTGGVIGGAIGKKGGDGKKGVVIGSVIGGTAGAIVGRYMDKQAQEIQEEVPGAVVETTTTVDPETGETVTESINVTFGGGVLFEFNSTALTANSRAELDRMAKIMNRYPDTDITIDGHTDSKGSEAYNLELSQKRAAAVADYLAQDGIARRRMITQGFGETRPVATNETDAGRAQNRRVVLGIKGTEALTRKAKEGTLSVPE
ncbi:OmpA family protein [Lewinella sp. 4G2]|uniref:OmpA family protein n=1 Tax=Lewinella sp. 4G2 TaxID=1803372 RepID=UPI0007B48418|nr:OmpA family protein [Lewinella sp. 4G2]OAV43391.1 hypothetical protein A3850_002260 [Lewinella sp. 4G2]